MLTSRIFWPVKKCKFLFIVILGKYSSQENIRIIWFKMKSWMILLLFRLWILQSSGSSWQYTKEWVYVLFCATADPKLAVRASGYGKHNWATICGKQQDHLDSNLIYDCFQHFYHQDITDVGSVGSSVSSQMSFRWITFGDVSTKSLKKHRNKQPKKPNRWHMTELFSVPWLKCSKFQDWLEN